MLTPQFVCRGFYFNLFAEIFIEVFHKHVLYWIISCNLSRCIIMEWFILQGPLPITVFVVEDVLERKYSNGGVYGTSYTASSVSQFSNISPIIVHEKHMSVLKKDRSFILMKYVTLQDRTLKTGIQSVVSFYI